MTTIKYSIPWFRRRLFHSNKPYVLKRSREDGERDLLHLAQKAKDEVCFAFMPDEEQWFNLTFENFNESTYALAGVRTLPFPFLDIENILFEQD